MAIFHTWFNQKTNPVWADKIMISDSQASNETKYADLGSLPISTATQTALNGKQGTITLTTTGTSWPATLVWDTLNIPEYWGGGWGSGDMEASTYDPANIAEQLAWLTATQTLTNKTISWSNNTLSNIDLTTAVTWTLPVANWWTWKASVTTNSYIKWNWTWALIERTYSEVKTDLSLNNVDNTSDATKNSATATLTNKTIALWSNTLSWTKAQFDTAVSDWNICFDWDAVTNLTMSTNKLLGRSTASTWNVEEITLGTWLSFSWTTLNATWGWPQKLRITIPWELIADTSNYQWLYFKNESGASWTISNVAIAVWINASWTWAACAVNLYKSSWTEADWINTSATNLFTTAVDLWTTYSSLTNTPNTTTVENGRWLSLRITSSAWATRRASDMQVIITLV